MNPLAVLTIIHKLSNIMQCVYADRVIIIRSIPIHLISIVASFRAMMIRHITDSTCRESKRIHVCRHNFCLIILLLTTNLLTIYWAIQTQSILFTMLNNIQISSAACLSNSNYVYICIAKYKGVRNTSFTLQCALNFKPNYVLIYYRATFLHRIIADFVG